MYMLHPCRLTGTNTSAEVRENSSAAVFFCLLRWTRLSLLSVIWLSFYRAVDLHGSATLRLENGCQNDHLCRLVRQILCVREKGKQLPFHFDGKLWLRCYKLNTGRFWILSLKLYSSILLHDKLPENYHPTLQVPSALWTVLASFSPLFWFSGPQLL